MRGSDGKTGALFSYVDLEARVGKDHPLRLIRMLVNCGGERLRGALFGAREVDCARERDAVTGVLFDSLGATAHGASGFALRHRTTLRN